MEGEIWYLNRPLLKNFVNISESSWFFAECLKISPNKGKRHFHLQVFQQQFNKLSINHFPPLKLQSLTHYFRPLVTDIRILWLIDDSSSRDDDCFLQQML